MIVLDTHAWIWWVGSPDLLSPQARSTIDVAMAEKSLFVSSISAWEVAMLVSKGRLQLTLDVRDWIARCEALPFLTFVPVDNAIAVQATRLVNWVHADPADRIIVSTALSLGAEVVSKDEKIRAYPYVKTIW